MKITRAAKKITRDIPLGISLLLFIIISISLTYHNNIILTTLILIAFAIGFWLWHKKEDIYCCIVAMIAGSVAEIISIHFGVWAYSNPSFLGIPI